MADGRGSAETARGRIGEGGNYQMKDDGGQTADVRRECRKDIEGRIRFFTNSSILDGLVKSHKMAFYSVLSFRY